MDLSSLTEMLGEKTTIALAGLVVGLLFGICAQRSRFCLRSAVVEFWNRQGSAKLAVWLFAFSSAIVATQLFITQGWLDVGQARQLSATGSLSGALVGGLLFGIGMILARGCSSRLLVLSAQGNLRSVLSGLVFAVTAQAAWQGALAPWRASISLWWTVVGGAARVLSGPTGPRRGAPAWTPKRCGSGKSSGAIRRRKCAKRSSWP